MRVLAASLLAGMLAYGVAPAAAETVCVHYDDYCANSLSMCIYAETNKRVFLAWRPGSSLLKPIPPATELPPRPSKITSCDAVKKEPPKGYCEATICGPTNVSARKGEVPFQDIPNAPAKGATVGPKPHGTLQPGLIEGDAGLPGQGPVPTGNAVPSTGVRGR